MRLRDYIMGLGVLFVPQLGLTCGACPGDLEASVYNPSAKTLAQRGGDLYLVANIQGWTEPEQEKQIRKVFSSFDGVVYETVLLRFPSRGISFVLEKRVPEEKIISLFRNKLPGMKLIFR